MRPVKSTVLKTSIRGSIITFCKSAEKITVWGAMFPFWSSRSFLYSVGSLYVFAPFVTFFCVKIIVHRKAFTGFTFFMSQFCKRNIHFFYHRAKKIIWTSNVAMFNFEIILHQPNWYIRRKIPLIWRVFSTLVRYTWMKCFNMRTQIGKINFLVWFCFSSFIWLRQNGSIVQST